MSSRDLNQREPIAPRTAGKAPVLTHYCCLRCSKGIAQYNITSCTKKGNRSVCERCASKNKPCLEVPPSCYEQLNGLFKLSIEANKLPAGQRNTGNEIWKAMVDGQKAYTNRVEAVLRQARIPKTMDAMCGVIVQSISRVEENLQQLVDILRFQNNLPPLVRDDPDDEAYARGWGGNTSDA